MKFYENKKLMIPIAAAVAVIALAAVLVLTLTGRNDPPKPTDPAGTTVPGTSGTAAPTTDPSAATTVPTTAPTEPTAAPTEPTTVPAEPTTAPTEPTTVPTEPSEPEPTTEPTEPAPTEHRHSYSAQVIREATCFVAGETRYTCSCGDTYSTSPTREHTYVSVGHEAPTCLEKGHDVVQCTACGDQRKWNAEDALGHAYGTWTVTIPATADREGQEQCVCTRCGDVVFRTIPKTGSTETPKTDVYTHEHQPAGRVYPERNVYIAVDYGVYGDGCYLIVMDQQISRPAQVEHIGYLTLEVTYFDNNDESQVLVIQIGGAEYPAAEYGLVQFTIKPDGSSSWFYSSHSGT